MHNVNIQQMKKSISLHMGMDILIISTSSTHQATFWQKRLDFLKGHLIKSDAIVLTVFEDWPEGAGNALGTLYAFQQANEKAKQAFHIDLYEQLLKGASIAIYHTAGKGKRLAPLTLSEANNKPAVKLPGFLSPSSASKEPISILEAVIKQTSLYGNTHKGRLSVFWGDQLFIPATQQATPTAHVDIFIKKIDMPKEEQWKAQELQKYGIVAFDSLGNAQHIDKCRFETIKSLIQSEKVSASGGIGISLGSFSLSASFTMALLEEFDDELRTKKAKLDTDPHLWMAATLDKQSYFNLMLTKNFSQDFIHQHYDRIQHVVHCFCIKHPNVPFFKTSDLGSQSYWWDYGTLHSYYSNIMKLVQVNHEASMMQQFFDIQSESVPSSIQKDPQSFLLNCRIKEGNVKNCILINVEAEKIEISDSILINVQAPVVTATNALLYQVQDRQPLTLPMRTVRADVKPSSITSPIKLYTTLDRNGEADWEQTLPLNPYSYADLYNINRKSE